MDKKLEILLGCWNLDNIEYSDNLLDIDSTRQVVVEDVKKVINSISDSDADNYFDIPEEIWDEYNLQPDDIVKAIEEVKNCIVIDAVDSQSGKISYHFDETASENEIDAVEADASGTETDASGTETDTSTVDISVQDVDTVNSCYIEQLETVRIQV